MDRALSVATAFRENHPVCRSCGAAPARPAIRLSAGDVAWADLDGRRERYAAWRAEVLAAAKRGEAKVVVFELAAVEAVRGGECRGGGMAAKWTAVRQESEAFVCEAGAANATLVRINEEYPLPDRPDEALAAATVSIARSDYLETLKAIDSALRAC